METYTLEEIGVTERASLKDRKVWTAAELIADLKRSRLTDDGIVAYLSGLEIDKKIELDKGMTLPQFFNILVKR